MGWIHVDHKMISWHQQTRLFLGAKRAVHVYFHLARYLLTMFYFSVRRNMWVVTYHSWLAFVLGGSAITSRLHARCKRRGCCITKILWRKHFLSWLSAIFHNPVEESGYKNKTNIRHNPIASDRGKYPIFSVKATTQDKNNFFTSYGKRKLVS